MTTETTDPEVARRLAHLRAVLHEHEQRGHELQCACGLYVNQIDAAIEALVAAKDAMAVTARLHREHHDALVASVIKALYQEVG